VAVRVGLIDWRDLQGSDSSLVGNQVWVTGSGEQGCAVDPEGAAQNSMHLSFTATATR
jgi:hypothetical protein